MRGGANVFFFQAEDGIRDYKVTGVQTCALPISAVPTAPKKIDCVAISRSAVGQTISALLPPSSMIVFPNRLWTVFATFNPIATEPVAEINGIRVSSANFWPTDFRSPISNVKMAGLAPVSLQTRSAIFVTAIAVSGVFSDGFQIVASPQTAARAAFQDQTATGKLNAVMTATSPSGCHCSIKRWFGRSD